MVLPEFNKFSWALDEEVDDDTAAILGSIPSRWGRMTSLSRAVIVEVGKALQQKGILAPGQRAADLGFNIGLIGGTGRGSLYTDRAFIKSMEQGVGLASPAQFGYTLPNIPLAEAAGQYGLVGPVYAVFDQENPLTIAEQEARRLLVLQKTLSLMLACEFDHFQEDGQGETLHVNLTVIERDAESYPDIS